MHRGAHTRARHRLLEGFVLRLAGQPDADAFVLRGGMLVRQWFPDADRPALDVDLLCRLPFDLDDVRARITRALGATVGDGVRFVPNKVRFRPIWVDTPAPGLRVFALAHVDGHPVDLRADVTFGLDPWPEPVRGRFVSERGEATLWMCRPESLIGRKLQVTANLGARHWRPKDVADLSWMLARFDLDHRVLGEAIEASLVGCAETLDDVRAAFAPGAWLDAPLAESRWHQQLGEAGRFDAGALPDDLSAVVSQVRARLAPMLGRQTATTTRSARTAATMGTR